MDQCGSAGLGRNSRLAVWLVILWFNACTISMQRDQSSKTRSQDWSQNTSQTIFLMAWDWRKCSIPDRARTWESVFVWNGISKRLLNLPILKTATQNCCCSDSPLRVGWLRERSRTTYLRLWLENPKNCDLPGTGSQCAKIGASCCKDMVALRS